MPWSLDLESMLFEFCHPPFLTYNMSDNIEAVTFKLDMTIVLWMPSVLMVVLMTLMQGHSGSAKTGLLEFNVPPTPKRIFIRHGNCPLIR